MTVDGQINPQGMVEVVSIIRINTNQTRKAKPNYRISPINLLEPTKASRASKISRVSRASRADTTSVLRRSNGVGRVKRRSWILIWDLGRIVNK